MLRRMWTRVASRRRPSGALLLALALLFTLGVGTLPAAPPPVAASDGGTWRTVARVSVATDGAQAEGSGANGGTSQYAVVSADGRLVAFTS